MKSVALLFVLAVAALATDATFTGPDGVSRAYTLKAHPRVWFDGPSGAITLRLKDPDGPDPGYNAFYDSVRAQGIRLKITNMRATLTANGTKNNYDLAQLASSAALMYWMCNQCVTTWNGSLTWLAYATELYENTYNYSIKPRFNPSKFGDIAGRDMGDFGLAIDYDGNRGAFFALGYSLIRDALTAPQRATIAPQFVNGLLPEDNCTLSLQRQPGVISKTGKTLTITGASWASLAVNDAIQVRIYRGAVGGPVLESNAWLGTYAMQDLRVTAAPVGNSLTVDALSGPADFAEGYYLTYGAFGANTCGVTQVFRSTGDFQNHYEPPMPDGSAILTSNIPALNWPVSTSGEESTITVQQSNWSIPNFAAPTPSAPWRATIDNSEAAEIISITNVSGNTLTILRGLISHGKAWTATPGANYPLKIYVYNSFPQGLSVPPNGGLNNRNLNREQSYLALALAFADDDARAVTALERAADHYSKRIYQSTKTFSTATNYSIGSYQFGRGIYANRMHWFMQNSFASPAADWVGGGHFKNQALPYIYWPRPWAPLEVIEHGMNKEWFDCTTTLNGADCASAALLNQLVFPNDDVTKYSWAHLVANGFTKHLDSAALLASDSHWGEHMTAWMWLLVGGPDAMNTVADRTTFPTQMVALHGDSSPPGGKGYKLMSSRSGWSSSDSLFHAIAMGTFTDKEYPYDNQINFYWIGKNGVHIGTPALRKSTEKYAGQSGLRFGNVTNTPFLLAVCTEAFAASQPDGKCPVLDYPAYGTARNSFTWFSVENSTIFKNPNATWAKLGGTGGTNPHGLTRHWRHHLHLKGGKERMIVYDDIGKTANEKFYALTPYMQNGEFITMDSGRTFTEGVTSIASDFTYVDSRTGGGEGTATRLITKWLGFGSTNISGIRDLNVRDIAGSYPLVYKIGPDASVSAPIRVKHGSDTCSFTSQIGTVTLDTSAANNLYKKAWVYLDMTDCRAKVVWDQVFGVNPVCAGNVDCLGIAAYPTNMPLLASWRAADLGGGTLEGCRSNLTSHNDTGDWWNTSCLQSEAPAGQGWGAYMNNARSLIVESSATTCAPTCGLMMVHTPTTNMSETPESIEPVTVTGTGNDHIGALIGKEGASPAVVVIPTNQARATVLTFTTSGHASAAHAYIAGLSEGTYKRTFNGGDVETGLVVGTEEATLYSSGLAAGVHSYVRTAGVSGTLVATPASRSFACTIGSGNPPSQNVAIAANGATLTNWTATNHSTSAWLSFTPSSGSAPDTIAISVNCAGLAAGNYSGTIQFSSNQAEISGTADVGIALTVSAPGAPILTATPGTLTFAAVEGAGNPPNQTSTLIVTGGSASWTVSESCSHLSVSPTSGTASSQVLTVSVVTGALTAAGSPYLCTVTISNAGSTNETIDVTFNVSAPASITMNVGSVATAQKTIGGTEISNGSLPFSSTGTLDNYSTSIGNYTGGGTGWLSISNGSGTTAANLTLVYSTSSLTTAGQRCADVTISSTTAGVTNTPLVRTVCVQINALPQIVETAPLYRVHGGEEVSIPFTVTGGTAPFTWQLTNSLPCGLSLSGTAGTTISILGTAPHADLYDYTLILTVSDGSGVISTQYTFDIRTERTWTTSGVAVKPLPWPGIVNGGVILNVVLPSVGANIPGVIALRDGIGDYVTGAAIAPGKAVRQVVIPTTPGGFPGSYELSMLDGTGAVGQFSIPSQTVSNVVTPWEGTVRPGRGITHVCLEYGTTSALGTLSPSVAVDGNGHYRLDLTRDSGLIWGRIVHAADSNCADRRATGAIEPRAISSYQ